MRIDGAKLLGEMFAARDRYKEKNGKTTLAEFFGAFDTNQGRIYECAKMGRIKNTYKYKLEKMGIDVDSCRIDKD